jgi:AAA+ ATPase superfamily predicted ATPase
MKNSPFIYGTTVRNEAFINRKNEIKRLVENLTGGINTTLISPRRWGKSSLVEKVAATITKNNKNTRVVVIDLFTVSSEEQFLEKFAREIIRASSSKWQEWAKNARAVFKVLIPKIQVGIDPVNDFSISFDWREIQKHNDEILNMPETIARQKGIKIIACIDEFQNIANFYDFESFEKKLRAIWQRQQDVTYCIYGSLRHMMNDIFNNPSKPFYRFGDIMLLQKIERDEWIKFICRSFTKTGKRISNDEAAMIPDLMQYHSWYVQQLAHYTWNLTTDEATKNTIKKALNELINANTPFYQKEIETLSSTQVNLLKAVVHGENRFTSVDVMAEHRLGTPRNVSKNKTLLINNDIIQANEKRFEFVDPAFELWFRHNFLNQPIDKHFRV